MYVNLTRYTEILAKKQFSRAFIVLVAFCVMSVSFVLNTAVVSAASETYIGCFPGSVQVTDNSPDGVAVNCSNDGTIYDSPPTGQAQLSDVRYINVSCSGGSEPTSGPFGDAIFIVCPEGEGTSLGKIDNPSQNTATCFVSGEQVSECIGGVEGDPVFRPGCSYSATAGSTGRTPYRLIRCESDETDSSFDENLPANFKDNSKGCNEDQLTAENCRLIEYLVNGINILSAIAGMVIIGSIIIAGYQYMTARDNAGQIQQARTRIIWAITAMILFVFMYALLNFLVPGGVL